MPQQLALPHRGRESESSFSIFFSGCKQPNFSTLASPCGFADAKVIKRNENWELGIENLIFLTEKFCGVGRKC